MPMLEGQVDAVIGVDTHRDRHAAALLDPNGRVRATLEVPSDQAGHTRLLQLAQVHASGRAQGPDRHRPRAAAGPPSGRPWRQQLHACAEPVAAPGDPVEHRATMRALALQLNPMLPPSTIGCLVWGRPGSPWVAALAGNT
jgi:hypothetical protein